MLKIFLLTLVLVSCLVTGHEKSEAFKKNNSPQLMEFNITKVNDPDMTKALIFVTSVFAAARFLNRKKGEQS